MADGVDWYFRLLDQVTAPAKQIEKSLGSAGGAFKQIDGTVAQTTASSTNAISAMTVAAGGFLADLAEKVLDVGGEFLKFGADLVVRGATFAAQSADFKRNTTFALQTMLGAGADARKTLDELEGYATRTGFAKDDFTKLATRALGAGFGRDELKPLLGAISDIRAANGGDIAAGEALFSTLMVLRDNAKKGINPRELTTLARVGISPDKIFAIIAAQRGVTLEQAKVIAEAGGIKGADALNAVMKTVLAMNQGGKLGGIGEAFQAGSITAQIQHIKDSIGDLFENVDIKPLTDFFDKINNGLKGGGAERIQKFVNDAFGQLVGWLSKISLDDVIGAMTSFASGVEKAWRFTMALIDTARAFGSGFAQAFGAFMPVLDRMAGWFGGGEGKAPVDWLKIAMDLFKGFGEVAGASFGIVVTIAEAVALAVTKAVQGTKMAIDAVVADFRRVEAIGAELVNGIWTGITSGWAAMMEKFHALIDLLPAAVKKVLGIASPSRVFAELGMQTARGFTVGLDAGDMHGAMHDAIAPPSPSAATITEITGRFGASTAGGRAPISLTFQIHTDGSTNAQRAAETVREEMERTVLPSLITAIEQLNNELGG